MHYPPASEASRGVLGSYSARSHSHSFPFSWEHFILTHATYHIISLHPFLRQLCLFQLTSLDTYGAGYGIVVILDQAFPFPVTSLATFAADRLQIYLSQFSHICALFCLHLEGGTSQQPFKSCLASLG